MEQRSAKEQKYIKDYYDNIVNVRKVKVKKTGHYKPCPYLMPAVKIFMPKLLLLLQKGIIKAYK